MGRLQFAVDVRDARLQALIDQIGVAPTLQIWGGRATPPVAAPARGILIASAILPMIWAHPPEDGVTTFMGPWNITAQKDGDLAYFRFLAANKVKAQGSISLGDGDGPMIVDALRAKRGYRINVIRFTLTEGNI